MILNNQRQRASSPDKKLTQTIAIIGAGAVGSGTAWHLSELGYDVTLIDPQISQPVKQSGKRSGTNASLGVLMGYVFRRSTGRAWHLRERSMHLWPTWVTKLNQISCPLKINHPLIQLANSEAEASLMNELSKTRSHLGIELLKHQISNKQSKSWPQTKYGGLISNRDGRIDSLSLKKCLEIAMKKLNVQTISSSVLHIEKISSGSDSKWRLHLADGSAQKFETIVICAANESEALLQPLGYSLPLAPVLGQVLEVEIQSSNNTINWSGWPAVLSINGINLIPNGNNRLLIGATVEQGEYPDFLKFQNLKDLNGNAPDWLKDSTVIKKWHGFRSQPINRPAPLLEKLEPGLILATGHYKNGILLTPATAEWVGRNINEESKSIWSQ